MRWNNFSLMVSGKDEQQDCTELNGRGEYPGQNDRKTPARNGAKTRKLLKPLRTAWLACPAAIRRLQKAMALRPCRPLHRPFTGATRRAIACKEGVKLDAKALRARVKHAVVLNKAKKK